MSFKVYEDGCPGCEPAILDVATGQPMPKDHPVMIKVMAVWTDTTLEERQSFHNVMCNNSREDRDMTLVKGLTDRMMQE